MSKIQQYKRKAGTPVIAIQLVDLGVPEGETMFTYNKWGGVQTAKSGDWLVNSVGSVYTIDKDSFAATYTLVAPGQYAKTGDVWAYVAEQDGSIPTKEGTSDYKAGDYVVFNNENGDDGYCVPAEKFESMYYLLKTGLAL